MSGDPSRDKTFRVNMTIALDLLSGEDDGAFTAHMDRLAVGCTDEEWERLVRMLEEERERLSGIFHMARVRLDSVTPYRPISLPRDGIVWTAWERDFDAGCGGHDELLDVVMTRTDAVRVIESAALLRARMNIKEATSPAWKGAWKGRWEPDCVEVCPCPATECHHEVWIRETRLGSVYIMNEWGISTDEERSGSGGGVAGRQSTDV